MNAHVIFNVLMTTGIWGMDNPYSHAMQSVLGDLAPLRGDDVPRTEAIAACDEIIDLARVFRLSI